MTAETDPAAPPAAAAAAAARAPAPRLRRAVGAARRFRTGRTVGALMLREMSTTYGRTPGGYLWAVLEPVLGIALFTIILSVGLRVRTPGLGTSFPLFFATGILPFQMFTKIANKTARALAFSRPLLRYPGVTWVDAILARAILNTVTYLLVFMLVIGGLLALFDTRTILDIPPILAALAMAVTFALGVGVLNCYLFAAFPLWESLWDIATTPLLLVSGVIFLYDSLPRFAQDVLWWNPLIHIIGMMRRGFYPTYDATYVSPAYVFGVSAACLMLGMLLLHRFHKDIMQA
jgi:capsular polysaccharide transport system permease protein